jgi:hypothetical protein
MFDHKHYVPILRWKRAERVALGNLTDTDRSRVTPLLELTPYSFRAKKNRPAPDPKDVLTKNAADMLKYWGRAPFFIDLCHLRGGPNIGHGIHPLEFLAQQARQNGLNLIPTTGLSRENSYQNAVASIVATDGFGFCLRIHPSEAQTSDFSSRLSDLQNLIGVTAEDTDLFLDYRLWNGNALALASIYNSIPNIHQWRTLTVSCGNFPRDLTGFTIGQHQLPRSDWVAWRTQISAGSLSRLPSFSDYTIQHAEFAEPPEHANFSASIRYACGDYWVIMRGESVFTDGGPGYDQWPANAQLLCARSEFSGPAFSEGDKYIFEMANQTAKTGSAETWLRAGINHHITLTARQIANLS